MSPAKRWSVLSTSILAISLSSSLFMTVSSSVAFAQAGNLVIVSAASSSDFSPAWAVRNAIDGDLVSSWSSSVHSDASHQEWISYSLDDFHNVNYIKLHPRHYQQTCLGFPVTFNVYWSNGSAWQLAFTYNSFPTPTSDDSVILPFQSTVNATGILVLATQLGQDDLGNYVLQFTEVGAGYDPGFNQLAFLGNDPGSGQSNWIRNVGSGLFDETKLSNWNYDVRNPIIVAQPGSLSNVYAPSVVWNGVWNVYFGGWDGTSKDGDGIAFDRISFLTTSDFVNFSQHVQLIDHGAYQNVNNASVIKLSDTSWLALYTAYPPGLDQKNKPNYAVSSDGAHWTPNMGDTAYEITMAGLPGWRNDDVNGTNAVYFENGTYYLYFRAPPSIPDEVSYATSSDGIDYVYQGAALSNNACGDNVCEGLGVNDVKSFFVNNTRSYLMGLHYNTNKVWYSVSKGPGSFPAEKILFTNLGANDLYIVSLGFVTDGSRLYGALYGAGPVGTLDHNAIHAAWLQKKVIFKYSCVNDPPNPVPSCSQWGDTERAYGPDQLNLQMTDSIETGKFYVYDTDGSTLLYASPPVTIRSGDSWRYSP